MARYRVWLEFQEVVQVEVDLPERATPEEILDAACRAPHPAPDRTLKCWDHIELPVA